MRLTTLSVKANRIYVDHGLLAPRRRAAIRDLTTVLTTTVTTVAVPATPPTRPFAADLAWLLRLPAPGSVGVRWFELSPRSGPKGIARPSSRDTPKEVPLLGVRTFSTAIKSNLGATGDRPSY